MEDGGYKVPVPQADIEHSCRLVAQISTGIMNIEGRFITLGTSRTGRNISMSSTGGGCIYGWVAR